MTFQHRAGVSPHTSSYDLAETCVFGKQLLGPILCGLVSLPRLPLLRTYGVNLPSSLTTLLPLVLGFSPHPPVSVYGTGTSVLDSSFSRQCEISGFGTLFPSSSHPRNRKRTLRFPYPQCLNMHFLQHAPDILLRPCLSDNEHRQYRNINLLSIGYACQPRLRSRLTLGGRPFPRKPWIFDGQDSHLSLVTYSDILTTDTSTRPFDRASTAYSKLLYRSFLIPQLRHTV